jgi:hypothetical protein
LGGDKGVGEIDRPSKAGPDEPINPAQVIARACEAISSGDVAAAASIIASDYPHTLLKHERRRKTIPAAVMIRVFLRDRFVDRYTGQQLIFGPALHLLSQILPDTFPAAQNWKMSGTHRGFYELFATVDHVLAQIHGGSAEPDNLVYNIDDQQHEEARCADRWSTMGAAAAGTRPTMGRSRGLVS